MKRINKDNYYLKVAEQISERSTCLRCRFGAVIVKNDEILSTGYNGAPRGRNNCCDINYCYREKNNIPHGSQYELCRSVHAEANAIISSSRKDMIGSTLYLIGFDIETNNILNNVFPCSMCQRLIINAGIINIITKDIDGIMLYPINSIIEKETDIYKENNK